MPVLSVFDPALCCSNGVCGPEVDETLVRFAADVDWLKRRGLQVLRYNLATDAGAFASEPLVRQALQEGGTGCLPLVLLDGTIVARGTYPDRDALVRLAGIQDERVTSGRLDTASVPARPDVRPPA
jgi:hypothetical protein